MDASRRIRSIISGDGQRARCGPRHTWALLAVALIAVVATACSSSPKTASTTTAAATATTAGTTPSGTGATGTPSPGVTATSVTVGQVDDLTLPLPGLFKGAEDGTQAYFDYVNSTGGVNGRQIKLDAQD
ncbi:MAG: hypothetical protein ACRDY1_10175, partial [Acidimicrobiales bacterium]